MSFNTKIAKTFAFATSLLLLPAVAHAEQRTFERDGVNYVYETSVEKGQRVITGTADRVPFRLVVRGRYVSGDYNYRPVDFVLPAAKTATQEVAVR